jgi:hypothetical protein
MATLSTTPSAQQAAPRELHAVSWRLDVPVATRTSATAHGEGPTVELQLQLATTTAPRVRGAELAARRQEPNDDQAARGDDESAQPSTTGGGEPAATTLAEEWISLDYESLLKLTQAVAAASAAMTEAPYRRVQRIVK